MSFGIDAEDRFAVLKQDSCRVAQILTGFAIDDDLAVGLACQIHKRDRVSTGRCLRRGTERPEKKE